MPLETATHINQLVVSNPANTDTLNFADDHMRLIKSVLLTDINGSMTNQNLTVPDGTSGAPSIGFQADATAGFYRKGLGQIGVVGSLVGPGSVDIGFVGMFAGASVPTGYLACDGQAVSRTTYAALFAAIGTTWGAGDGSTTFNVPGLLDKFPRHRDVAGAAGAVGTVQANQNAAHTHSTPSVAVTGTTDSQGAHQHNVYLADPGHHHTYNQVNATPYMYYQAGAQGSVPTTGNTSTATTGMTIGSVNGVANDNLTASAGAHTHNVTGTAAAGTSGSQGGTEARPEAATLLFCIRAL
jgi:microcystin-dependent protein